MRRFAFLFLALCAVLVACEGARNNSSWSQRDEGTEIVPSLKTKSLDASHADAAAAEGDSSGHADSTEAKH